MRSLETLPPRDDGDLLVVVESPRGSAVKLKYDPDLGAMTLTRSLVAGTVMAFDFGFVPGTKADDGDPLDAIVLLDAPTAPGVVVRCRPIGIVRLTEKDEKNGGRERNDRVVAVAVGDRRHEDVKDAKDLGARERSEIEQFFVAAAALEGKELGVEGWGDARAARKAVDAAARARPRRSRGSRDRERSGRPLR